MILVERGGERQIPDELIAYNPLIPDYNSIGPKSIESNNNDQIVKPNSLTSFKNIIVLFFVLFSDYNDV
jgi:hypothetical protein